VADLKLPDGIKAVRRGSLNPAIVSANPPRVEEEAAPAAVVAPAAAATKAKKSEKQNKK
jgi:large subunit ribosomal protein L25